MILVSFLLIVVALAALGVGSWIVQELWLIYVSIGISMVAAVFLAVGMYRGREEIFGGGAKSIGGSQKGKRPADSSAAARAKAARSRSASPAGGATRGPARTGAGRRPTGGPAAGTRPNGAARPGRKTPASTPDVPGDAIVVVVPGRRRYHLSNCRQLAGRTREELTYQEAREEGFTACTACMPDTALVARGSPPEHQPEPAGEEAAGEEAAVAASGAEDDETDSEKAAPAKGTADADLAADADAEDADDERVGDDGTTDADGDDEEAAGEAQEGEAQEGEIDTPTEQFGAVTESSGDDDDDAAAGHPNGKAETAEATEGASGRDDRS
ncbi:MAG: hypothetical protein GEV03_02480 [Streptosporangiales bacterium]|nr:hypothetical protein [Streptosporangiales bacterium]